ncbi:MAG: metal-dependent hydrolase [Promethearchaeota archaeon]
MAIPLLFSEIPIIKKYKINRLALIIGSLLPDLIDKPIFLLGIGSGRFISHSLLFVIISFLIVFLISNRKLEISIPFLVGMSFHLILDLPNIPLFYPFIEYHFVIVKLPFFYWITTLFTNPIVLSTEIIGIIILIFIIIYNKLYHIEDIKNYLKGNLQPPIKKEVCLPIKKHLYHK